MKLTNEWITGFVDGDGSFSITSNRARDVKKAKTKATSCLRFRLIVSQDRRSVDVLYAIKKHLGCGTVCKSSENRMEYSISNRLHLRDKVIPHFRKYPLQTKKRIRFLAFANKLYDYMKEKGENPGLPLLETEILGKYNCTPGWFRGIVDADGCFTASIVAGQCLPKFILGMQPGEGDLIKECHRLIGCGTLHTRLDGFETLQVANIKQIEQFLVPFFETRGSAVLLRTIKRISFQKWRKIVRLMMEKRHLDPAGWEKIIKYQSGLNKHNQSLDSPHSFPDS